MDLLVSDVVRRIEETKTSYVFFAFGAPKQEVIMMKVKHELEKRKGERVVLMVVGGAFDVWAGKVVRAPGIVRVLNLEWLWRLVLEPWRIGRQVDLVRFVGKVMMDRAPL
jgi:exopolysaccharide biosynthesis WecB/TagA/CpsF family protein